MILLTGCAGFIGMHCAQALLAQGEQVVGIDNLNAYYDVALKEARLERLRAHPDFAFERMDVADRAAMAALFARVRPARVLHLAAQAGVRYSIDAPDEYTDANLLGFANVLQGCRTQQVRTWCSPARPASTAATPACLTASATRWTTPSATTPPPRRPTR